jgi:hypothetical protein
MPNKGDIKQVILKQHHDDPMAGYFGNKRTQDLVSSKYFRAGLHCNILKYCATCALCHQIKAPTHRMYGELQLLPTPMELLMNIAMYFNMGLPTSSWYKGSTKNYAVLAVVN